MTRIQKTLKQILAIALIIAFGFQNIVWANPEIGKKGSNAHTLQVPSFFLYQKDENVLLATLMCIAQIFPIKDLNFHLIPRIAGIDVEMDFYSKWEEGEDTVVPCSLTSVRSCRLYEAVITPDKTVSLRKPGRKQHGSTPEKPQGLSIADEELQIIDHIFKAFGIPAHEGRVSHELPRRRQNGFDIVTIPVSSLDHYALLTAFNLGETHALSGDISIIYYDDKPLVIALEETDKKTSLIDISDYYFTADQGHIDELVSDIFLLFPKCTIVQISNNYTHLTLTQSGGVFISTEPPDLKKMHDPENTRVIKLPLLPGVFAPLHSSSTVAARATMSLARPGMKVLVIGTGCGVEAVIAGLNGATVEAIDLKNMANENTELSAGIAGVGSKVSTKVNDLLSGLGQYDLIVFNMPIIDKTKKEKSPTPSTRNVRDTEENLMQRVAAELPAHLTEHGIAALINDEFHPKIMASDGKYYDVAEYIRRETGMLVETDFFQTEGISIAYIVSRHGRNAHSGTHAGIIVRQLDEAQKEFQKQTPVETAQVEVLFSLLPQDDRHSYFACARYGVAEEHADLTLNYPFYNYPGDWGIRGDMKGPIEDITEDSHIKLGLPLMLDEYERIKGVGHDDRLRHTVNDLILSAQVLINGGVPAGKRLKFKTEDEIAIIQIVYPEVAYTKTIGELAKLPLLIRESVKRPIRAPITDNGKADGVIRRTKTIHIEEGLSGSSEHMRYISPQFPFSIGYLYDMMDRYIKAVNNPGSPLLFLFRPSAKQQGRFVYDMLRYISKSDNIAWQTFANAWISILGLNKFEDLDKHPSSDTINDYVSTHNRFIGLEKKIRDHQSVFSEKLGSIQNNAPLYLGYFNGLVSRFTRLKGIKVVDSKNPNLNGYTLSVKTKYIYADKEATLADLWAYIAHEVAHHYGAEEGFSRAVDVEVIKHAKTVAYSLRYVSAIAPPGEVKAHMGHLADFIEYYALDYELDIHTARLQTTEEGSRFLDDHLLGKIERAPPGYIERVANSLNGVLEVEADPKIVQELIKIGESDTVSANTKENRLTRWAIRTVLRSPRATVKSVGRKVEHIYSQEARTNLRNAILQTIESGRNIPMEDIASFIGKRDFVEEAIELLSAYLKKSYDPVKNKRAYRLLAELHRRFTHNEVLISHFEYLAAEKDQALPRSREAGKESGLEKLTATDLNTSDYYFMLGDVDRLNNRNKIFSKGIIGSLGEPSDPDVVFSKRSLFAEILEVLSKECKNEGFDVSRYLAGDEFVPQGVMDDARNIRTRLNIVRNAFRKHFKNRYGVAMVTSLTDKEKKTLAENPDVLAVVRHEHGYNVLIRRDGYPFNIQLKLINGSLTHTLKPHKFNNGLMPAFTLSIGAISARAIVDKLESLDGVKRTDETGHLDPKYADEVCTWGMRIANDMLQVAKTRRNAVFVNDVVDEETVKKPITVAKEKPVKTGIDRLTGFYDQEHFRKKAEGNLVLFELSSYNGKESRDEGGFHAVNTALGYDDANEVLATLSQELRDACKSIGLRGAVFGRAPPDKFFISTSKNITQKTLVELMNKVRQRSQDRLLARFGGRFDFDLKFKVSSVSLKEINRSKIPEFKNKFRVIDTISKLEKVVEMTGAVKIEKAIVLQRIENAGEVRIYSSNEEKEKALRKDYRLLQKQQANEAIESAVAANEPNVSRSREIVQFLRDLSDLDQLPQNMIEAIYSVLFEGKKLIFAFDRNLSRFDDQHSTLIRQLANWKERVRRRYPKLADTMDNFIIIHFATRDELSKKLKDTYQVDVNDVKNNLILTFSPQKDNSAPINIGQAVYSVYINEGERFPIDCYYPLLEIVTITLAKALKGYTKDEIYAIFESLGLDREKLKDKLNIDEISDGADSGFLIFTLIPRAKRYDPDENFTDRYVRLLRFLQSA